MMRLSQVDVGLLIILHTGPILPISAWPVTILSKRKSILIMLSNMGEHLNIRAFVCRLERSLIVSDVSDIISSRFLDMRAYFTACTTPYQFCRYDIYRIFIRENVRQLFGAVH